MNITFLGGSFDPPHLGHYKIAEFFKNKCDFYITKDETFVDNISKTKLKKYIDLNFFSKSKILSSDFK